MATLAVQNLTKAYYGKRTVDSVSLSLEAGKVVGLLGPNGAGKTTTFYMTVGLIRPTSGQVFVNGEDITNAPMYIRSRKGLGYLPQEASVFRKLTVEENILAILETMPLSRADQLNRMNHLLEELGITHIRKNKGYMLSGGERRRLEISRALATNPLFILLDEPFAGVDPLAVVDIQNIIKQLTQRDIGILISDHNVRETLGVCDHAYILSQGKIIESGSPEHIASSEIARRIYLGESFRL
ncbi:MAG: LPS export ABC transporter ATP-binding protein [Candidatus Magnetomorum sp.]|nr:LPS export ABC transporter ATP-binding protein [Candidatus Magnetomorum sp.]